MPPAFNLSQDQTLQFNHCNYFKLLSLNSNELLHFSVSIYASRQPNQSQTNYHHNTHTYRL